MPSRWDFVVVVKAKYKHRLIKSCSIPQWRSLITEQFSTQLQVKRLASDEIFFFLVAKFYCKIKNQYKNGSDEIF